jgi:hypothetical protein
MISTQFLTGGRAVFTVESSTGEWRTFRVASPKDQKDRGEEARLFFVSLLTGPDNIGDFTYLGVMARDPAGRWALRLTAKSRLTPDSLPVRVFQWSLRVIQGLAPLPEGYAIHHEGRCCRCGRTLTVPESITSGIGPECAAKYGTGAAA